jgi:hypothetical protein
MLDESMIIMIDQFIKLKYYLFNLSNEERNKNNYLHNQNHRPEINSCLKRNLLNSHLHLRWLEIILSNRVIHRELY